ncbi:glycosyltransferase family 4 protein [Patescibacteria group bacterium]
MKITFLSRMFHPHIGGVETHIYKLSKILIKRGHKITVITEQHDKSLFEEEIFEGIHIHRIPTFNHSEKDKKFYIWQYLFRNRKLLTSPDIVHVHDVFFWVVPLKLILVKPVFTTFHGWEGEFPPKKSAIHQKQLAITLSSSTIAVGDFISNWYQIRPNFVTYGATDKKPVAMPKTPHIIVYGRLSQDNDSNIVINGLKKVKKESKVKITFLGDGEYKTKAEKLGSVTGYKKNVLPILKKSTHVITSSYLSILDAMIVGRPVCSVYSNLLKQDYLRLHPRSDCIRITNDSNELALSLLSSIKKSKIDDESVKKAQKWAQKQTWESIADLYEKIWEKAHHS